MKVELRILISAYPLIVLYICSNFHEKILKDFIVIERTLFSYEYFQTGIGGVTVLVLCTPWMVVYICIKFCKNTFQGIKIT